MLHETFSLNEEGTASLEAFVLDRSISYRKYCTRPAMIVCPGGGYMLLATREQEPIAARFLGFGYDTFILRYPVYFKGRPENGALPPVDPDSAYPRPLSYLMRAMAFIHENASRWGIDETRIYACGFSAGGHLVATLAEHWDDPEILKLAGGLPPELTRPRGVVMAYPMISASIALHPHRVPLELQGQFAYMKRALFGTDDPSQEAIERVDLRLGVRPDMPRVFIWGTAEDEMVPAEEIAGFVQALARANVPVEAHLFQCGLHGKALFDETTALYPQEVDRRGARWVDLARTWLRLDDLDSPSFCA